MLLMFESLSGTALESPPPGVAVNDSQLDSLMHALADDQVQLWLTRVTEGGNPALLQRYAALLNEDERARWQRFVYPADRHSFLLARALVRGVLGGLLQQDPAALRFAHNSHGKPQLDMAAAVTVPINENVTVQHLPSDDRPPLQFNLSHTDGLVALAVSRSASVGLDVESVNRQVELLALSSRYFSTGEHEALLELSGQEQRERFFALWTLKEAWLKARGLGLHIPLDDFSFSFEGKTPVVTFGPQLEDKPEDWQFRLLRHAGHYRLALAVQRPAAAKLTIRIFEGQPLQDFRAVGG